jgi:NhaP-type Na+/H+ or K+/H+ antiporter
MTLLTIFIVLFFLYSLVSKRLDRTVITAPILFTAAGMLALPLVPGLASREHGIEILLHVAEVGLVLLLFTDASRTDLRVLQQIRTLPVRLLTTGMLLTLLLGALAGWSVLGLSIWEAGILSAILAPTDAGLGQVIVNSPRVPIRIRQALNVEAGLNDGLSVPFLLFFLALVAPGEEARNARLAQFMVEQLGYGAVVGGGIGLVGGWFLGWASRVGWMEESRRDLAVVALPLLCVLLSMGVGASMFIAAFVAGLAVQVGFREAAQHSVEFTEGWGQLLNLSVFFLFGLLAARVHGLQPSHLVYALLSLTVVRMLPVAVALLGTRLSRATVLFMGWFGPRGLASIVLGLVYLEHQAHTPGEPAIRLAIVTTVLLSVFLHGLSTLPGIEWYGQRVAQLDPSAPERLEVSGQAGKE